MLSATDNELLTRTGPGTPMGELLPALLAARASSPASCPSRTARPCASRVLGEELVAFRDSGPRRAARPALPAPRRQPLLRPQRGVRAPLRLPRLEVRRDGRVRGHAHDAAATSGASRDRVARDRLSHARVGRLRLGVPRVRPSTQPALPELEFALVPPAHRFVSKKLQQCNWAQACEGGARHRALLVPAHAGRRRRAATAPPCRGPRPMRADALDAGRPDAGVPRGRRTRPASCSAPSRHADGDDLYWRVTQFLMPNHSLAPERLPGENFLGQTWVPIDDDSCWVYFYSWNPERPLTDEREPRFIPGVQSVHAEVDEHWVPIRNRDNDYLIDRDAAEDRELHRHPGHVRAGRRHPGQPGAHRRPHARAPRPDRRCDRPVPAADAAAAPRSRRRRRAGGGADGADYTVRSRQHPGRPVPFADVMTGASATPSAASAAARRRGGAPLSPALSRG